MGKQVMTSVLVIGGGPAGIMAAITAAENGAQVQLWERNDRLGRKLAITGKGRCNITNNAPSVQELVQNIPGHGNFLYGAFSRFSVEDTMNFFEYSGLPLKTERGRRVFPESDKAADVVDFSDVKAGLWYSDAVNWASANDIVIGYADGTLGPNDNISREQLAVMLYRFAEHMKHENDKTADLSIYKDNGAVGTYAQDAVAWASGNGFLTGRSADTIALKGDTSRAEAATVLMRYCEAFEVFKTAAK